MLLFLKICCVVRDVLLAQISAILASGMWHDLQEMEFDPLNWSLRASIVNVDPYCNINCVDEYILQQTCLGQKCQVSQPRLLSEMHLTFGPAIDGRYPGGSLLLQHWMIALTGKVSIPCKLLRSPFVLMPAATKEKEIADARSNQGTILVEIPGQVIIITWANQAMDCSFMHSFLLVVVVWLVFLSSFLYSSASQTWKKMGWFVKGECSPAQEHKDNLH